MKTGATRRSRGISHEARNRFESEECQDKALRETSGRCPSPPEKTEPRYCMHE